MRAAAEIDEFALAVDRDLVVFGEVADDLGLVRLADGLEVPDGVVAVPDFAGDGFVAGNDLAHPRLHRLEVGRREGLAAREVVVEAVLDRRADRDLDIRIELLRGLGEGVCRVVPDELQDLGARVLAGHDLDRAVAGDGAREIAEGAVEADRERGLGETGRDRGGDIVAGDRAGVAALRPVREGKRDGIGLGGHGAGSSVAGCRKMRRARRRVNRVAVFRSFWLSLPYGERVGEDSAAGRRAQTLPKQTHRRRMQRPAPSRSPGFVHRTFCNAGSQGRTLRE